jgi:hypothetical protein
MKFLYEILYRGNLPGLDCLSNFEVLQRYLRRGAEIATSWGRWGRERRERWKGRCVGPRTILWVVVDDFMDSAGFLPLISATLW